MQWLLKKCIWHSKVAECRLEIRDQIRTVFDPGGDPHQSLADAECLTVSLFHRPMRGRVGVGDQALGVAEIIRDIDDLEAVQQFEGCLLAALYETSVPKPLICFAASACCGWEARPG